MVARGRGERRVVANGHEVSLIKDDKVIKMFWN